MLFAFLAVLAVVFAFFLISHKQYSGYTGKVGNEKPRFMYLLPVGLFLLDIFKKGYSGAYDRKFLFAAGEVYGVQDSLLRLRLHWAEKIVLIILSALFSTFTGVFSRPDGGFVLFCVLLALGAAYLPDRELMNKVKKRRAAIQKDFPDFINKLALLINAGLTVQKAWEKAALCPSRNSPLYKELNTAVLDIKAGKPEHRAYEEFAKRCRTPEITRFVSVMLQNIRKGNSELVPILRVFSAECWEMRKNNARRYGEEASTRMLLPMMLMFLAVLLIVGMPAVLSLRGIW